MKCATKGTTEKVEKDGKKEAYIDIFLYYKNVWIADAIVILLFLGRSRRSRSNYDPWIKG